MTEVNIVVPSWMSKDGIEETENLMEIFCEALSLSRPDGIAGVPVSFAMANMIIGTLGSAFNAISDTTAKANVLFVASAILDLITAEVERMKSAVPKQLAKLAVETEGNA